MAKKDRSRSKSVGLLLVIMATKTRAHMMAPAPVGFSPGPPGDPDGRLDTHKEARLAEESGSSAQGWKGRHPLGYPMDLVVGREIVDSRGNPTVEVDMYTGDGMFRSSVPSGASTGVYEACELRDGGSRYNGKGVLNAVKNVNEVLRPMVVRMDPTKQQDLDDAMLKKDGADNKTNMGANAILGGSLAAAKAGAASKGFPLYQHFADLAGNDKLEMPVPTFNVINGGEHAGNGLAFQEFMILPTGADTFSEAMQIDAESVIKAKYGTDACNVGDEGGFAPNVKSNREGCELLTTAMEKAGHTRKVGFGMDVASSEFHIDDGMHDLDFKNKDSTGDGKLTAKALGEYYTNMAKDFPIVSIEDGFDQDDWAGWIEYTGSVENNVQTVGDDLTVTNIKRIKKAAEEGACNALLLEGPLRGIASLANNVGDGAFFLTTTMVGRMVGGRRGGAAAAVLLGARTAFGQTSEVMLVQQCASADNATFAGLIVGVVGLFMACLQYRQGRRPTVQGGGPALGP